jgi:surface polysaccharide O-acyltransferase-like enzyme
MTAAEATPLALRVAADLSFVLACASGCFLALALCLRFANTHLPALDAVASNGYGIYLFHYVFVVWLQYALLFVELVSIAKAMIVFGGALLSSWATTAWVRHRLYGS